MEARPDPGFAGNRGRLGRKGERGAESAPWRDFHAPPPLGPLPRGAGGTLPRSGGNAQSHPAECRRTRPAPLHGQARARSWAGVDLHAGAVRSVFASRDRAQGQGPAVMLDLEPRPSQQPTIDHPAPVAAGQGAERRRRLPHAAAMVGDGDATDDDVGGGGAPLPSNPADTSVTARQLPGRRSRRLLVAVRHDVLVGGMEVGEEGEPQQADGQGQGAQLHDGKR